MLERHPELRVGLVEFTSSWFAPFLPGLDAGYRFHAAYNGLAPDRLPLAPSDYLRRQVRIATFGFERPERLTATVGDLFMFGSDYPHAEGLARPLEDFQAAGGPPVDENDRRALPGQRRVAPRSVNRRPLGAFGPVTMVTTVLRVSDLAASVGGSGTDSKIEPVLSVPTMPLSPSPRFRSRERS